MPTNKTKLTMIARVSTVLKYGREKSVDDNSTRCSQAVTHPSTNRAQRCLTSVIGRELVFSTWYGRCREKGSNLGIKTLVIIAVHAKHAHGLVTEGLQGNNAKYTLMAAALAERERKKC